MSVIPRTGRRWEVVDGPKQEDIQFALFCPANELRIAVTVVEVGISDAQPFKIEIEVEEIWAGNVKTDTGKKRHWQGSYYFSGFTRNCPQLIKSADPEAIAKVTVSCQMGKLKGELEITGIG